MAPPTMLTEDTKELLLACAREGLRQNVSAERVGVDASTLSKWLSNPKNKDFANELKREKALYKRGLLRKATELAHGGHWNSLQYLLEASGLGSDAEEIVEEYKKAVTAVLKEHLKDDPTKLREISMALEERGL